MVSLVATEVDYSIPRQNLRTDIIAITPKYYMTSIMLTSRVAHPIAAGIDLLTQQTT